MQREEGIVLKDLESTWQPGNRDGRWVSWATETDACCCRTPTLHGLALALAGVNSKQNSALLRSLTCMGLCKSPIA